MVSFDFRFNSIHSILFPYGAAYYYYLIETSKTCTTSSVHLCAKYQQDTGAATVPRE